MLLFCHFHILASMKFSLLDIILIVLFVQLLSLTPFLLFDKSRTKASQFLALFLIAKAFCISSFLGWRLWDYTFDSSPILMMFGSSFTLLWGPLIYFYTRSLADKNFKFGLSELLHISPFIFHFGYLFFNYHIIPFDEKQIILTQGGIPKLFYQASTYYTHVSILIYTLYSFYILKEYHSAIKNTYSSLEKRTLTWMIIVLVGFSLKWIADIWFFIEKDFLNNFNYTALYISRLALFIFVNSLIYFGFKQGVASAFELLKEKKVKKSLSVESRKTYAAKLTEYMQREKPWRDPDITLSTLSEQVGIPQRSLSEVIKVEMKMNFYDYINLYRIQESKEILAQVNDKRTVLEILFEVGFNNKTSFNSAFKRITGMTPTQFRNSTS